MLMTLIHFLESIFGNSENIFLVMLESVSLLFPLILGAYFSISLMKVPDLSIETAYVFGAIFGAKVLIATNDLPFWLCGTCCLLASLVGGVMVGITSSVLTHKAKFPHLLSSIITAGIYHGIHQYWLDNSNLSISVFRNFISLAEVSGRFPELPVLTILIFLLVLLGYLFLKTQLGTSLAVYGNNPQFFDNYNISTQFVFITGIAIANGLAGFAGFVDAQVSGFVDINMGTLKALYCITSIILGKTFLFMKRPFSIIVPLLGSAMYFIIIQGLLKVAFNLKFFTMVQSIIVAGILIVKYQRSRSMTSHLGV